MTKPMHLARPAGPKLHDAAEQIPGGSKNGGASHWRMKKPTKAPHVGPPLVTIAPVIRHDPRFQCGPGERPFGAGFAAAGVGIDVTTGKPWGEV